MDPVSGFFEEPMEPSRQTSPDFEMIGGSDSGFCEVYKASRDGKFRAFKCLKAEYRGNPIYEGLLRKEFEIGYHLSHPNICEVYSWVFFPELGNCIEMEWVDGISLENLVSRGKLRRNQCEKIFVQICDALSYVHFKQVIHRDLKPSNILITYNGSNVKLLDFGLSDTDYHSTLKMAAGTARFAAPELLTGGTADCRSDIYSLGCIIAYTTDSFDPVVRKCCRRGPEKRYQSAGEVKADITKRANWNVVAFVLFVVAALIALAMNGWKTRSIFAPDPPVPAVTDTIVVPAKRDSVIIVRETIRETPPVAQPAPPPAEKTDTATLDEIFRQASDLFD